MSAIAGGSGGVPDTVRSSVARFLRQVPRDCPRVSKTELITIVDYSVPYPGPAINATYFANKQQSPYWSSIASVSSGSLDDVWTVDFNDGVSYQEGKGSGRHVLCARGAQYGPFDNFSDNSNGTVTDAVTGLMWQHGETGSTSWYSALSSCSTLSFGGYSDWRLPNIKELESLTDDGRYDPAIDTKHFPDSNGSSCWSSTSYADYPGFAWYVSMGSGGVNYTDNEISGMCVRCVRG